MKKSLQPIAGQSRFTTRDKHHALFFLPSQTQRPPRRVFVNNETFELFDLLVRLVIADEARGAGHDRRSRLDGIWCFQPVPGTDLRCLVRDIQAHRDPGKVRIARQQGIELKNDVVLLEAVWLDEDFKQRERGRAGSEPACLYAGE